MPQTPKQKAVVRRWVKALESGEYKQGKERLVTVGRDYDKFCCLGVLCDMEARAKVIPLPSVVEDVWADRKECSYSGKTDVLPPAVKRWAGIYTCDGRFGNTSLAELNDSGASFHKIAKIIRSKPQGLFIK